MSDRTADDASDPGDRDRTPTDEARPDAAFRFAVGGYVGVLVAGLAATVASLAGAASIVVVGVTLIGSPVGCLAGVVFARRVRGLPIRLGRTWRQRTAVGLPAVPFGAVGLASMLASVAFRSGLVALASAFAITIAGYVVTRMARTRFVDAVTGDEPAATWRWDPPGSPRRDALLLLLWLILSAVNAASGEWLAALAWFGIAAFWLAGGLAEGRWWVDAVGATPKLRVHDAGLVIQRPYARSLVPWREVSHVRLREDELVLDRDLRDVRFDRDELADLEAVRAAIDRHRQAGSPGARS